MNFELNESFLTGFLCCVILNCLYAFFSGFFGRLWKDLKAWKEVQPKDDCYKPPYVYYSLNPGPTTLNYNTYFTFFTQGGRVKVRVVGTQNVPAKRWCRKFAKVLVEEVR